MLMFRAYICICSDCCQPVIFSPIRIRF